MEGTLNQLTQAEIDRLRAYCEYETLQATADHLDIGVQTLKNHLAKIYAKLGVHKAHSAIYKLGLSASPEPTVGSGQATGASAPSNVVITSPHPYEQRTNGTTVPINVTISRATYRRTK